MKTTKTRCDFCDASPCVTDGDYSYKIAYSMGADWTHYDICTKCWNKYVDTPTYAVYKKRGYA